MIYKPLNCRKGIRAFLQEFKLANGNRTSEHKQIHNGFNDFFISIGDVGILNANIIDDFNQYMPRKTVCTLKFEPINVDTASRIIGGVNLKQVLALIAYQIG